MPADSPAHGLGPHVVGLRVVVRRLLRGRRGPSGGPAMSDVLGVCLSWADGRCLIERQDGTTIEVATADIVSGKPVPPRASPRLRVTPVDAQIRAMSLFGDLETAPVGDWVLRHSAGHRVRRANSVLAMSPAGVMDAYETVVAFYAEHGQPPIAAVQVDSAEEDLFVRRGWVPESPDAPTVFELTGVASARRLLHQVWTRTDLTYAEEGDLVTVRLGDRAQGVGVLDGDWVGLRGIAVAAAYRRQGLGLAVLATLLQWAAQRGASTAYLQVLGDNRPALALYDRVGFVEHHRYRYLAAPQTAVEARTTSSVGSVRCSTESGPPAPVSSSPST